MRPGRMKTKARARRRRVAVTAAGVGALTVLGGTAAYAGTGGGSWDPHQDGNATLHNGGDAKASVDQESWVDTEQLGLSNTGKNPAISIDANVNLGAQECNTYLDGGNISDSEDYNTAGNNGGNCTNDGTQDNHGSARANVETGDARTSNNAHTDVSQNNSGGADANNTANDNEVKSDDGSASLHNGGNAHLYVDQYSGVGTFQAGLANSGGNTAVAANIGVNAGYQSGTTNVSGGNVDHSSDHNTAGNNGGNASNTASQSNTGNASASVKTGNAASSNSSTTSVNQTNSGGASATNTANGNHVSAD